MNDPHLRTTPFPSRRTFLKEVAVGASALATTGPLLAADLFSPSAIGTRPPYRGPNVVIIRFGGGARRRETIDPGFTYSPFLCHELTKRGTLFKNMEISSFVKMEAMDGKGKPVEIETSHGQGTLYIVSGKYDRFKDVGGKF